MHSKILILDFWLPGYPTDRARRVRDAGVFSEVVPYDIGDDFIREYAQDGALSGIILSGGPNEA